MCRLISSLVNRITEGNAGLHTTQIAFPFGAYVIDIIIGIANRNTDRTKCRQVITYTTTSDTVTVETDTYIST